MDITRIQKTYIEEIEFLSFVFSLWSTRRIHSENAGFNTYVVKDKENDVCEKNVTAEECSTDTCFWSKDIPPHNEGCISKTRKQYLHSSGEISTVFKGSNICKPPVLFSVLDSSSIESSILQLELEDPKLKSILLYYRIVVSLYSNITYIGFNCGVVIKDDDYVRKIKPICDKLIPYLETLPGQLCLCGWSMGGSFALGLAYYWIHRNPKFFDENVKCVLLCPFNVLPDDSIHGHPNIKQYVNKDDKEDLIDPFLNKGGARNIPFSPITIVSSTTKNEVSHNVYPDGPDELHWIERYTENITNFIKQMGGRRRSKRRTRHQRLRVRLS
jgi:hypothetical protein